jgi:putative ABC transport system ATP-binding protein
MNILRAENISRSFKVGNMAINVLKGINLEIDKGTFNILMGPSGSGKTTLLNILGALDRPDSGKVFFEGQDVTRMSEVKRDALRRSKLGFVFQSVALVSNMTAYENIDFALRISKYNTRERKRRVEECLDLVGLKKRMKHYPGEMSGGEQQRVAIARAIAHKPVLLLADEPTAELDTNTGLRIVKLFKELVTREEITIVMCTHDPSMMGIADRIYTLEDGVIINVA